MHCQAERACTRPELKIISTTLPLDIRQLLLMVVAQFDSPVLITHVDQTCLYPPQHFQAQALENRPHVHVALGRAFYKKQIVLFRPLLALLLAHLAATSTQIYSTFMSILLATSITTTLSFVA